MEKPKRTLKFEPAAKDEHSRRPTRLIRKSASLPRKTSIAASNARHSTDSRFSEESDISTISSGTGVRRSSEASQHSARSRSGFGSMRLRRRTTGSGLKARFQPTYRFEPRVWMPLKRVDVMREIKDAVESVFDQVSGFENETITKACKHVRIKILRRVKQMVSVSLNRCRYICIVTAVEKFHQDCKYATGFLWDAEKDNYYAYVYEDHQKNLFVIVNFYSIYFD